MVIRIASACQPVDSSLPGTILIRRIANPAQNTPRCGASFADRAAVPEVRASELRMRGARTQVARLLGARKKLTALLEGRNLSLGIDYTLGILEGPLFGKTSSMNPAADLPGIDLFRLDGRTAIITGGSKGLGFAMAAGLASAGARLMLVSRRGSEAIEAAEELSARYGLDACGYAADVTDAVQVKRMVQAAMVRWRRIDILINSAGINIRGPIDELNETQFDEVMRTNVRGVWLVSREVVPAMKAAGYGRIINLASALGVVGLANRTPYTSSKGAVVQMTRALGIELAPFGITCNAICPGPFLTEMNVPIANTEEAKVSILGATAMKRWGELKEIQGAALYLASPGSSYTTGSLLTVDGGWTAQ